MAAGIRLARAFGCLILFAAIPILAADEGGDGSKYAPEAAVPIREMQARAIAYPNGAIYLKRGITGAFMGGKHRNLGETQSLYKWQGEIGYFYRPWLSGGLGFRIIAGEPTGNAQKIFNRYFLNVRWHHAWKDLALYAGPQIGVGNLNILMDTTGNDTVTTPVEVPKLKESIVNTKPTLSLDLGGGWKFSKYVGFTLGNNIEYSFVTEEGVGWSNALNIHINPGFAIDVLAFTDTMRKLVPAMFVNIEVQSGFLIFEKRGKRQDRAAVLGISLAF